MKALLFKLLKGRLTGVSLLIFLSDILTEAPEYIEAFKTSAGQEVSYIGVAAAAGMIWGVVRRFFASYKFDD